MTNFTLPDWPRAYGQPSAQAVIRRHPGDFLVDERLGFEPEGEGEHCWLQLEKIGLNTAEVVQRIALLAGVRRLDVGYAGLKDRNAITRQWFSVHLPGQADPDWSLLEGEQVRLLAAIRHPRKLRRGVHSANAFRLRLADLSGDRSDLQRRLDAILSGGVPNYFAEQRFGRQGATLQQALDWAHRGGPRVKRARRGLYLSALRSLLFNTLLAQRVEQKLWNTVRLGDVCMLRGTRSLFVCDAEGPDIWERLRSGDLHPGLPLWGVGERPGAVETLAEQDQALLELAPIADFLLSKKVDLAHRPARVVPDDFSWEFCDDGGLRLAFTLPVGSYATAVLREVVQYTEETRDSGGNDGGE